LIDIRKLLRVPLMATSGQGGSGSGSGAGFASGAGAGAAASTTQIAPAPAAEGAAGLETTKKYRSVNLSVANGRKNGSMKKSNASSVALGTDAAVGVKQAVGQEFADGVSANSLELPSLFPVWFTMS
jgi:hypothetical protein